MEQIISGKRYDTDTATLLADDKYWDGHNWERMGRNQFLYKSAKGNFFKLNTSHWEGEQDKITPLDKREAMELYEGLRKQHVEYELAFDEQPEEA